MSRIPSHDDRHLQDALDGLAQTGSGAAPDLTRSIMGRLGYMRVSPEVARKRFLMKWGNRAGMIAVGCVALALGWRVFESSPQVRRPNETTLPQAISHDVQQQQERIGSMLQTIRQISSPKFTPRLGQQFAPHSDQDSVDASAPPRRRAMTPQAAPGSCDSPFSVDSIRDGDVSRSDPSAQPSGPVAKPASGSERPVDFMDDRSDHSIDHSRGQQMRDSMNRDRNSPVRWA